MLRICLDCRMASWSGVGRYTRGLSGALGDAADLEVVRIVAGGDPGVGEAATEAGTRTLVAWHHPFSVRGSLEYGRLVRDSGADVVHSLHFPVPLPVRVPCVVTMHDISPLVVPGLMSSAVKRSVYRLKVRRAVSVARRIVTLSEHTAQDLRRELGVEPERMTVVPAAADEFAKGPVGELPGWLSGHRYVLSMGNTRPHKDLPTLVRAFAALEDRSLVLVLAGEDAGGYVASALGDDPAASRVRFTGLITDDTLRALYARAELFVFPSLYEGFGLPPLEAMSFGTPVVVARAASLPEVVGDAGLYFEAGDWQELSATIARVISDPAARADLAARGKARAAGFTWFEAARRMAEVYRSV